MNCPWAELEEIKHIVKILWYISVKQMDKKHLIKTVTCLLSSNQMLCQDSLVELTQHGHTDWQRGL